MGRNIFATTQSYIQHIFAMFQYKILNNILYLNNTLYTSKLTNSSLCSFCKHENETTLHIFYF